MPNTRPKKPGTRCVGAFCAVYGCSNYQGKTRQLGVSYHSFPRDPELQKIWIKKCRRADKWNPAKSYICSDHFCPDNFRRDLKAELMKCRQINQLIPGALPSRNLPQSSTTKPSTYRKSEVRRSRKRMDTTKEVESEASDEGQPIMCLEYSVTESQRPLLIEIHTETDIGGRVSSQVVCSEVLDTETLEAELEDEKDFSLKTDIERLKDLVREKDDEISLLEQALTTVSSEEKRKRGVAPSDLKVSKHKKCGRK